MEPKVLALKEINSGIIRAVADIEYGGIILRGLKLIEGKDGFTLDTASRKINNSWQKVYELTSPILRGNILCAIIASYRNLKGLA